MNHEYLPTYSEVIELCKEKTKKSISNWFMYQDETHIYEYLNSDYIDALAKILAPYKRILEVGAGNGRLSHFLRQRLPNAFIVATDNGSWGIEPVFPVEKMEYTEALEKHKPEIVISCWMPYADDWTPEFRGCDSVKGYVLIGETDGGCCGREDLWFGSDGLEPGYERDGFIRHDLDELRLLQVCRSDYNVLDKWRHSSTVIFLRRPK